MGFPRIFFAFLLLVSAVSANGNGARGDGVLDTTKAPSGKSPAPCNRIECPSYDVIHVDAGKGYEIRRYNSTVWKSTAPIVENSIVVADSKGVLELFIYIQGKNKEHQRMEMAGPVLTQVSPGDSPNTKPTFTVSFYIPKKNQPNPPEADGLKTQKWGTTYVAVRQFTGFVSDSNVRKEAAALAASLEGTKWAEAIKKGRKNPKETLAAAYTVAQYNSPIEFINRVNEIWLLFTM